ncbi:MAG: 3-hydroxyacyl-CoA dehydrogenase family protein [Deltaproteobacteria bacterium]|nr:3-hydroxyacyl-CoA dehydrogenase family protein [Deltaproteobacteria bacterium]
MTIEEIKRTAVIGAGMMGSQIAELLSRIGNCEVNLVDMNDALVEKGIQGIEDRLERFFVSKGKITEDEKKNILRRIKGLGSLEDALADVDFVIEAATENLDLKLDLFKKLDTHAPPNAFLASNTSFQNISEMASATERPEKVVGMHFFNPVSVMKLVEVVRGSRTSDESVQVTCDLASKLGKKPVVCRDTSYGFLANRAYIALAKEAIQMVWERVAPPEEIDKALKLGYNLPMGPLEVMDFTGTWMILVASEPDAMRELGPEKGHLHPLVRAMSRAGYSKVYDFWNDILSKW